MHSVGSFFSLVALGMWEVTHTNGMGTWGFAGRGNAAGMSEMRGCVSSSPGLCVREGGAEISAVMLSLVWRERRRRMNSSALGLLNILTGEEAWEHPPFLPTLLGLPGISPRDRSLWAWD